MNKTIIFDLDGTLSDTAVDLINSANILFSQKNIPLLSFQQARTIAGKGARALIEFGYVQAGKNTMDVDQDIHRFLEIYAQQMLATPILFDGVYKTLEDLKYAGWVMGICSNKPEQLCIDLLKALEIDIFFDAVLGGDTLSTRKPDPAPIHETIKRLNGNTELTFFIGDTITDRNACLNANIKCFLFSGGYADHPVESYKPEATFDYFSDLPVLLKDFRSS